MYVCTYMYIYIYIYRDIEKPPGFQGQDAHDGLRASTVEIVELDGMTDLTVPHVHLAISMYECIYLSVCMYTYTYTYTHTYTYVHISYIYIDIYIYI